MQSVVTSFTFSLLSQRNRIRIDFFLTEHLYRTYNIQLSEHLETYHKVLYVFKSYFLKKNTVFMFMYPETKCGFISQQIIENFEN